MQMKRQWQTDMERKEAEIDEEGCVAVLFNDKDQEEDEEEHYEIRDDTDKEDEREEREGEEMAIEREVQEEDIVIGREASRTATLKAERDVFLLTPLMGSGCSGRFLRYIPTPSWQLIKQLLS
jgi:hypothetical protein